MWKRLPWSKPDERHNAGNDTETGAESSSVPSWTMASSAPSMGGISNYGVSDHLQDTTGE